MERRLWKVKELSPVAGKLGRKYNISPPLAQILLNRHIPDSDFNSFLNPLTSHLASPLLLPDIQKAVQRINQGLKKAEKMLLVGDYDVDGITSLAIFYEFIKKFPHTFSFYIPHRSKDGYGLNKEAIARARAKKASLIICFDCGTNSSSEIDLASKFGIDVIVIDHHHPQDNFNNPFAFINPQRKDSFYPFPDLSSAALSFKLLQVLKGSFCEEVLDLVALSLVCDVVPLRGENRILLKEGLKQLRNTQRPAIGALCEASSIKQQNIDTFHIGYILGPRINASGRVAHAEDSLEIFLTDDERQAFDIAVKLREYNQLRKNIEAQILREAQQRAEVSSSNHAIVVWSENWHPGVLGIVASRLVDKYYRPSFVISFQDNVGKGSARSIPAVHLMEVLEKCCDCLHTYGGHRKAAGIQIFKEELEAFQEKINFLIEKNLNPQDFIPVFDIDLKLDFEDINMAFIEELEKLKPLGEENPPSLFVSYNVRPKSDPKKINSGFSLWLSDRLRTYEGIIYDKDILEIINYAEETDIVYSLEKNSYHNSPKLIIRDCRLANPRWLGDS